MLANYSWTFFLQLVALLVCGYYLVVLLLFFRRELLQRFRGGRVRTPGASGDPASEPAPDLFSRAQQLKTALQQVLAQYQAAPAPREQLVQAIRSTLRDYPELRQTGFEVAINNYLQPACEELLSLYLTEADLQHVWSG